MVMLSDASLTKAIVSDVVMGVHEVFGASVSMVGGGSSDNLKFKKSSQFLNDTVYTDAAVGLLLVADSP